MRCMLFPLLKIRDASPSDSNKTKEEGNVVSNKISEMVSVIHLFVVSAVSALIKIEGSWLEP